MEKKSRKAGQTSGNGHKRKKVKINKGLIILIDIALTCVLVFSLVMLTVEIIGYVRARKTYNTVREAVSVADGGSTAAKDMSVAAEIEAQTSPSQTSETVPAEQPETEEPATAERVLSAEPGISVNWEALREENKDIAAWLYCPGTMLNYPVVYPDDNEYYLDHDFYGSKDDCGALFFDCNTELHSSGPANWIIYGHRRNDKTMFGILSRFGNESFLNRFPVMYLMTPEHSYRVELFACRTIRADAKYFPTWFENAETFQAYIDKAMDQSYWYNGVEPQPDDIILTMVTCNKYDVTDDPRLLLHGRLVALD